MRYADLRADAVIIACAISAGVHAALAPGHFRETIGAGAGFVVAAVALAALALVLMRRPGRPSSCSPQRRPSSPG